MSDAPMSDDKQFWDKTAESLVRMFAQGFRAGQHVVVFTILVMSLVSALLAVIVTLITEAPFADTYQPIFSTAALAYALIVAAFPSIHRAPRA